MSNAKKKDAPRQDRRHRAFTRFDSRAQRNGESDKDYAAYLERKAVERASLARHLGVQP